MRQTIKIGMVLLLALTVSLGWNLVSNTKKNEGQLTKLTEEKELVARELDSQERNFTEIMQLVTDVEDQIQTIMEKENLVLSTQQGEYLDGKERLMKEIAMIDDLVVRSKEDIESLAGKLKTAGLKANVLQNKINRLTATLQERTDMIAELKADIATKDESLKTLNVKVGDLEKEGARQAIEIVQKDVQIETLTADNNKLNKVHFAVGTYADLKAKGLVQKEGGFLVFGRKTALTDDPAQEAFAQIDGRQFSKLPIEGKKLELVSDHPSDSFVIVEDEDNEDVKYLEILDAEEFWRISKYLVVSVK